MRIQDFQAAGFYYQNGAFPAVVDDIMQDEHGNFWRLHEDPKTSEVYLQGGDGETKEPDKLFLESCSKPWVPEGQFPKFPQ